MTMALTQVTGSTGVKKPVDFADGEKARFGTGNDLEIHHDGSNSWIQDVGTGNLNLTSNGNVVQILKSNGHNMARFVTGGAAELYHNNSKKLETKSDGIDVTGEVQCDSLDVDGTSDLGGNVTVSSGNLSMHSAGRIYSGNGGNASAPMIANGSDTNTGIAFPAADTLLIATGGETAARFNGGGSSQLYHDNSQKLETTSTGVDVTGSITCDGLVVDGTFTQSNGTGLLTVQDDNNTGNATLVYIKGTDSANTEKWFVGHASTNNQDLYLSNNAGGQIRFRSSNADRIIMQAAGHLVPQTNNSIDLGTSSNRWRNVYTNDLNLSNEGSANDVDGTWGNFTIQEGEDDLFLINRRNGKKYKFNLTEVN